MITQKRAAINIGTVLKQATEADLTNGHDWYEVARERCQLISDDYKVPLELVAHVVAILSPGVRWETNVSAARKLFAAGADSFDALILAGYRRSVDKAKRAIINYRAGLPFTSIISGRKVIEFAENILKPNRTRQVTLDTHAISVAMGRRFLTRRAPDLRIAEFTRISKAYIQVAEEHNIMPNQCQAITWLVWRRLHNGRTK